MSDCKHSYTTTSFDERGRATLKKCGDCGTVLPMPPATKEIIAPDYCIGCGEAITTGDYCAQCTVDMVVSGLRDEIKHLKEKAQEWHDLLMIARGPDGVDPCEIDSVIASIREALS